MNKIKWFYILLCTSLLVSPMASANAQPAVQQQIPHRDTERIRQSIITDPAKLFLPQSELLETLPEQATEILLPAWSSLAFQSYRNNNWNIFLANPGATSDTQLTNNSSAEVNPSLAPGGNLVAFASNRSGNYDIYTQAANGSAIKQLAQSSADDTLPVFSPDSSQIVFQSTRSGLSDLYLMNRDGTGLKQLTNSQTYDGEATWSPDGSKIAFISNRNGSYDIWMINSDGSNPRQLTFGANAVLPAWSPRGIRIAFSADANGDGFFEMWWMSADGSNPSMLVHEDQRDFWGAAWSPDGERLAMAKTDSVFDQGQWWWSYSYLFVLNPDIKGYYDTGFTDDRVMRLSWASSDNTSPGPCSISLKPAQTWDSFLLNWTSIGAIDKVTNYDIQSRSIPAGAWQDFLARTPQTGGVYQGKDGDQVEFRCRARNGAGIIGPWSPDLAFTTTIHSSRPTSRVSISDTIARDQINVNWSGSDASGKVSTYDVFVRDAANTDWVDWLRDVSYTSADFTGEPGHTYNFRSQAHDLEGHTQGWQPDSQATATIYDATLTVQASDARGNQVPLSFVNILPGAVGKQMVAPFKIQYSLVSGSLVQLSLTTPGFEAFPNTPLTVTGDQIVDYILPSQDDQVKNGGFETNDLNNWNATGSGMSIANTGYTGLHSLELLPGVDTISSVSQTLTLNASLVNPTLSFLYKLPSASSNTEFWAKIAGDTEQVLLTTSAIVPNWTHIWADLSAFAGQTVTITFQASGAGSTIYVDQVSLGSWDVPQVESVTPQQWQAQQATELNISGQNFKTTSQVYLNNTQLGNVQWISATQLKAVAPPSMLGGYFRLKVVNLDGKENYLAAPLALSPLPTYLPVVTRPALEPLPAEYSDWLTLGHDDQHTGYSPNETSVSIYSPIWSLHPIDTSNVSPTRQVVSADGIVIFVETNAFSDSGVFAYQIDTGRELWRFPFSNKYSIGPATIANGTVYFQENNNASDTYLFCLDLYSGQKIWQVPFIDQWADYNHPLVVGQNVYIKGGLDGGMFVFNAATGARISYIPTTLRDNTAAAYNDGKIYTWRSSALTEHDPLDGSLNWIATRDEETYGIGNIAPVITQGMIIDASYFALNAFDLNMHTIRWSVPGHFEWTMPATSGDLVFALNLNSLHAYKTSTGELAGSFTAPENLVKSPILTPSAVYISTANTTYMLDRATLQVKWATPEGGWLTVANGYLFIARADGYVSAYRAEEP